MKHDIPSAFVTIKRKYFIIHIFFMYTYPIKPGIKCNEKIYLRLSVPNAVKKLTEKLIFNLSDLKQFKKLKP